MHYETLFTLATYGVLPGWLLLLILPDWRGTRIVVHAMLLPALLAVLYVWLVIRYFGQAEGGFGSLADVALLFQHPYVLLAGWVHYLCFDLVVGTWISENARSRGISRWISAPCLVFTLFLGPSGLLMYLIARTVHARGRNILHQEF